MSGLNFILTLLASNLQSKVFSMVSNIFVIIVSVVAGGA